MGTATTVIRRLTPRQGGGRVVNAIAQMLRERLTVPEIYLRPRSPALAGIEVLAVDHAGSGDVHGVQVASILEKPSAAEILSTFAKIKSLPLHYKYLAIPDSSFEMPTISGGFRGSLGFDSNGIGRVGLVTYPPDFFDDDPSVFLTATASLRIKPERFLLRGEKLAAVERFLAKRQPDMRIRI